MIHHRCYEGCGCIVAVRCTWQLPLGIPFATLETGYNYNKDNDIEVAVWTNDGELAYTKHLYGHLYQQSSWSYNSENMFFPVTSTLILNAQYSGTAPEKGKCQVYVIGY